MLPSWCFITVAELEAYLGLTPGTINTTMAEIVIAGVTGYLEGETARKLKSRVYTPASDKENAILDGDGSSELWLKQYPVTAISQVKIDGVTITLTPANDFYFRASGLMYYGGGFTSGMQNVEVSHTAGYISSSSEYYELRMASLILAGAVYNLYASGGAGTGPYKSETIGDYSYTVDAGGVLGWIGLIMADTGDSIATQVLGIIKKYRRRMGM